MVQQHRHRRYECAHQPQLHHQCPAGRGGVVAGQPRQPWFCLLVFPDPLGVVRVEEQRHACGRQEGCPGRQLPPGAIHRPQGVIQVSGQQQAGEKDPAQERRQEEPPEGPASDPYPGDEPEDAYQGDDVERQVQRVEQCGVAPGKRREGGTETGPAPAAPGTRTRRSAAVAMTKRGSSPYDTDPDHPHCYAPAFPRNTCASISASRTDCGVPSCTTRPLSST